MHLFRDLLCFLHFVLTGDFEGVFVLFHLVQLRTSLLLGLSLCRVVKDDCVTVLATHGGEYQPEIEEEKQWMNERVLIEGTLNFYSSNFKHKFA